MNTVEIPILTTEDIRRIVREELERAQAADELLDAKEAAAFLKVKVRTLWEWRRLGKIPFVKVGPKCYRYKRSDLREFVSQRSKQLPTLERRAKEISESLI